MFIGVWWYHRLTVSLKRDTFPDVYGLLVSFIQIEGWGHTTIFDVTSPSVDVREQI